MIKMKYLLILIFFGCLSCQKELKIVDHGKSEYVIVIPHSHSDAELKGAYALQSFLEKSTKAILPIVHDTAAWAEKEILIGSTNRLRYVEERDEDLQEDGFHVFTRGEKLYIRGGAGYGSLYGVNELLEKYWDYRRYTSTVEIVPERQSLVLPVDIDDKQIPVLSSRNMLYRCADDESFLDWLRLTQTAINSNDRGKWGFWVHSFGTLLPAKRYFKEHPEYYTMNENGERVPSQLCLSNPEVLDVLCKELDEWMEKKPDAVYWSVSQNDSYNYCKCPECSKIYEEEGSPSGLMVRFVNQVAKRYPHKIISTLAYQFTRKPPKLAKPSSNVNIMFCNIECNRSKPIAEDPASKGFREDMNGWAKLTDNILLWDYMVQFSNLYTPFPNFRTLQPNMQYFVDNNVCSVFAQGNPQPAGELCHLRAYVAAKLLWNPYCDVNAVIDDFLTGYYGAAGIHIRSYIDLLHDNLELTGEGLNIFGTALDAIGGYLSPNHLDSYKACFDRAEEAVKDNKELLDRVKIARLPLVFVELEQAALTPVGDGGLLIAGSDNRLQINPFYLGNLDYFYTYCKRNGTNRICEWRTTIDEYRDEMLDMPQQYRKMIGKDNKALGKNVSVNRPLSIYKADGSMSATDGLLGARNFNRNWLGFKHDDFEIVIDLGRQEMFSRVNARFLQSIYDRMFIPNGIDVLVSNDNKRFVPVKKIANEMDRSKIYKTEVLEATFAPQNSRYVKIKVDAVPVCPSWHQDAKTDAWTLVDEVAVY